MRLDVDTFDTKLTSISNIDVLISEKECIKNQIIAPEINWESRMRLYKRVQLINERIQELREQ